MCIKLDGKGLVSAFRHDRAISTNHSNRTLQEGVLSGDLVFPLSGSTAYLSVLWNYVELRMSSADMWLCRIKTGRRFLTKHQAAGSVVDRVTYSIATPEPFRDRISSELHIFLTASLNVDEYRHYAREPVSIHPCYFLEDT
jgi:hypothetical protein